MSNMNGEYVKGPVSMALLSGVVMKRVELLRVLVLFLRRFCNKRLLL